jgi:large subunit ribosomal protein L25
MTELIAQKREILGRKVKHIRKEGLIPAELYGHGVENMHLSLPEDSFGEVYKDAGEHSIVNIVVDGKSLPVLINNVQKHPITQNVLSVDLHKVRMDEKVKAHVPLSFEGESPAVEDLGGVMVKPMSEIEVDALPADIPDGITVDISGLTEFDQSIYVKDLDSTGKFEFAADPDAVVVSVSAPREEEIEEVPEEEELSPEDVVVEGEEKRAKEEAAEGQPTGDEGNKEDNSPET